MSSSWLWSACLSVVQSGVVTGYWSWVRITNNMREGERERGRERGRDREREGERGGVIKKEQTEG